MGRSRPVPGLRPRPMGSFMDASEDGARARVRATGLRDGGAPPSESAASAARNLLEAERSEDAAKIYEDLGMWKEAGEARRHGKRHVVTQVQVDVNSLIDQVRKGGLTTTYSCPACHSPIQIDANVDVRTLKHCQYCGSTIQSTDLVEFLSR